MRMCPKSPSPSGTAPRTGDGTRCVRTGALTRPVGPIERRVRALRAGGNRLWWPEPLQSVVCSCWEERRPRRWRLWGRNRPPARPWPWLRMKARPGMHRDSRGSSPPRRRVSSFWRISHSWIRPSVSTIQIPKFKSEKLKKWTLFKIVQSWMKRLTSETQKNQKANWIVIAWSYTWSLVQNVLIQTNYLNIFLKKNNNPIRSFYQRLVRIFFRVSKRKHQIFPKQYIDWLIDWLEINGLIDSIDWLIDEFYWLIGNKWIDWLIDWLIL